MPEVRRVVLDITVYDALKAEALVRHENLKSTLSSMVLENLSQEAREVLKCIRDKKTPKATKDLEACGASPVIDAPDAETRKALSIILEELEAGREPTVNEVAEKMGLTTTGIGRILSACGIKAHNTHRDNKTVRIYTKPMKSRIEEILGKE